MTDPDDAEIDALVRRLKSSARADLPPEALTSRVLRTIGERQRLQRLAAPAPRFRHAPLAAAGVAAALALAVVARWSVPRAPEPTLSAEPAPKSSAAPPSAAPPSAAASARPALVDPCSQRVRAGGHLPLIDDFEDGDAATVPLEGRKGNWYWNRDSGESSPNPPLLPVLRPDARPGNRFALHVQGGRLRSWGASVELALEPGCYDASAYAGISLVARGPGRVYLTSRQVDVVPTAFGGTCQQDCFKVHSHKLELESRWKEYRVRFSEFEQAGYDVRPLDITSLHDVSVHVHAEDTPYDLWVDDFKFLERDPHSREGNVP